MQSVEQKVIRCIRGNEKGWAFSNKDFADLGSAGAVDLALHRLVAKGAIRRVCRGIYDCPEFSDFLGQELSPALDAVARAFARKFGWRIQPSGESALNLLGLSTQVPARYTYLTDGPSRSYKIGKLTLEFRKAALKEAGLEFPGSALVTQALKALGRDRVDDEAVAKIRDRFPPGDRKRILDDTKYVTGWVYELVKRICRPQEDA